jgi:hypothetical protein
MPVDHAGLVHAIYVIIVTDRRRVSDHRMLADALGVPRNSGVSVLGLGHSRACSHILLSHPAASDILFVCRARACSISQSLYKAQE